MENLMLLGVLVVLGLAGLSFYHMRLDDRFKTHGVRVNARVIGVEYWGGEENQGESRHGRSVVKVSYIYNQTEVAANCMPYKGYLQAQPGDMLEVVFFPEKPDRVYKYEDTGRSMTAAFAFFAMVFILALLYWYGQS